MTALETMYQISLADVFKYADNHYGGNMIYTPTGYLHINLDNGIGNSIEYLSTDDDSSVILKCDEDGGFSMLFCACYNLDNNSNILTVKDLVDNVIASLKYITNTSVPENDIFPGGMYLNMPGMVLQDLKALKHSHEKKLKGED